MEFIQLKDQRSKETFLEQVWSILESSYRRVPGGLHFASPAELIATTDEWHLIIKNQQVQALTLHKYKRGLKLVALAKARTPEARLALTQLVNYALRHGWMELSDKAESFVMRECEGHRFMINASLATRLLNKVILPSASDTFHYQRTIMRTLKTKLLLGTPDMSLAA